MHFVRTSHTYKQTTARSERLSVSRDFLPPGPCGRAWPGACGRGLGYPLDRGIGHLQEAQRTQCLQGPRGPPGLGYSVQCSCGSRGADGSDAWWHRPLAAPLTRASNAVHPLGGIRSMRRGKTRAHEIKINIIQKDKGSYHQRLDEGRWGMSALRNATLGFAPLSPNMAFIAVEAEL